MRFDSKMVCCEMIRTATARIFSLKLAIFAGLAIAVFAASASLKPVVAQQSPEPALASAVTERNSSSEDTRYRIGPGDVLSILVRKSPELSLEAVRVDQRGMIRIPMIEGEVMAACRTEGQLANQIATLYLEYKKQPGVQVFVREFQSRPVSVIGAVNSPGQFRLQRKVKLLELLSFAGGPSGAAGRVVHVIHTAGPIICEQEKSDDDKAVLAQGLVTFKLTDTLKGTDEANPFVQPGDIVSLPEADQVFVVGYVYSPRAIPLKDKPISVTRAVAMAGGPQREAKTSRVHIVRQANDGQKQDLIVDLKAISQQKAEDILLLPNDIVEVPSSTGKILLNALTGALGPALSQGVVRVIP